MKLALKKLNQAGNALLVCMMATGIIGIMLAAYLTLVKSQTQTVARSQTWNTTVSLIEAGMEEAMAHLNMHGATNLYCDGWTPVGTKFVSRPRELGEGFYVVSIDQWLPGTNCTPVIESRAFLTPPVLVVSTGFEGPFVAAAGLELPTSGKMARGVRSNAKVDALFSKGLVAKGQIDMNGNNIRTDSFDSLNSSYSNNGRYDSSRAKANGDIATDLSVVNSVNIGNADIHGSVSTGPKGTVQIGNNGSVSGKITDDMNVAFNDVVVPFASGGYLTAPSRANTNINGTLYAAVFDGPANYKVDSIGGNNKVLFTGTVSIWLPNGFSPSGNGRIDLADGAKVAIYTGAPSSIGGNGMINNGDSSRLIIYGLPGCTSLSFAGNASFTGCIYAPNAAFSMSGGGNNTYDFVGASITKSVTMNGHFNFHYDEALRNRGPIRGFVLTSWDEMSPGEVANLPYGAPSGGGGGGTIGGGGTVNGGTIIK